MKKRYFLFLAFCCMAVFSANAQLLPITQSLTDNTGSFSNAELMKGTNVNGIVASGGKGTATLSLDTDPNTDGVQAYNIKVDEVVTFSWVAYHGWLDKGKEDNVTILNSEGKPVFSYAYTLGNCNVTNVQIAGETAPLFKAFNAQGKVSSKNANGWVAKSGQAYLKDNANNTVITVKVYGLGNVEVNMKNEKRGINNTYSAKLPKDFKIDLASLKLTNVGGNTDRSVGMNSLSIVSEKSQVSFVDYTVQRKVGETVIDTYTTTDIKGSTISLPKTPWYDNNGKKYIYLDDNAGELEEGSTFVINYKEAATYSYSIVSDKGSVINAGSDYEGEVLSIGYPRYYLNKSDSTLVEAGKYSADGKEYRKSITLDANNKQETVAFDKGSKNSIAFYTEGEDIAGATVTTSGNIPGRASNARAAKTTENLYVTSLPAGKYVIHVGCFTSSGTPAGKIVKLSLGDRILSFECTGVNLSEVASAEVAISKTSQLVFLADGSGDNSALDYLYIEKTGNVVESNGEDFIPGDGPTYDPDKAPEGGIESATRPEHGMATSPSDTTQNDNTNGTATGINGAEAEAQIVSIVNVNGAKVNSLQKGINIVTYSNGKRVKIMK